MYRESDRDRERDMCMYREREEERERERERERKSQQASCRSEAPSRTLRQMQSRTCLSTSHMLSQSAFEGRAEHVRVSRPGMPVKARHATVKTRHAAVKARYDSYHRSQGAGLDCGCLAGSWPPHGTTGLSMGAHAPATQNLPARPGQV